MTVRTQDDIYEALRDNLQGRIAALTNFTESSFNYVWSQAFSEELREREIQLTAAQLSGWVNYSGGPLTQEDLNNLGLENVTVEELEEYIEDDHLEELVALVGIDRDTGTPASGSVTFTTQNASTSIPSGTEVGTQPDSRGDFLTYETISAVSTDSGVTTVDANVEAVDVGAEFNIGAGAATYLPDPPSGVQAVTNAEAIEGGEDIESNDDLRERAKDAVFQSSGGGTVEGMIGYIEENTGATEVTIIEFPDGDSIRDYPHGHVVVSGGTDEEVVDAIEQSRPVSVEHILRRPNVVTLNIEAVIEGGDFDTSVVEDDLEQVINDLELGNSLYDDRVIFAILNADPDIDNIVSHDYTVNDEAFFFDSSDLVYTMQLDEEMLDEGLMDVTGTRNGSSHTFVDDTDYQEWNSSAGDTSTPHDSLDWSVGVSENTTTITYSDGQTEYDIDNDMVHSGIIEVVNNTEATTLTEGTDYETADTSGDDLHNGVRFLDTQSDGDSIDVTYDYGDLPDINVNQTQDETFVNETSRYNIDDAIIQDGINEVTGTFNSSSHTFVEGTDYNEWDSNGDGQPEGIQWIDGGDAPDDDTVFTVNYDAGTQFLVDYDIDEDDIEINQDEAFTAGNIDISEAQ